MPTQDYTSVAGAYKAMFTGQGRSNASATISANEQFDRDNLLHFVEDNFKTNGQGVEIEKFRALMHVLIKSIRVQKDDFSKIVLLSRSARIASSNAGRSYFPSPYYGYSYTSWTTFLTGSFDNTTMPSFGAQNGNSFPETPFEIWDLLSQGRVQNSTSTGEVVITMYYCDPDDATNANFQNVTYIGQATVDCAVTDTDYPWAIQHVGAIPSNKKILTFVQNTGYTSGTEQIYFSQVMSCSTHNSNYSQT